MSNRRGVGKYLWSQGRYGNAPYKLMMLDVARLDVQGIASLLRGPLSLQEAKNIHAHLSSHGLHRHTFISNLLLSFYAKHASLEDAQSVFEAMPHKDVVSWTAIISAHAHHGHHQHSLTFFRQMIHAGIAPDKFTFTSALRACTRLASLADGELIHTCIVNAGFVMDTVLGTALLNMYGKCGALHKARLVFDKMSMRDVITWNAMISLCAQHGDCTEALQLFKEMQAQGIKPNKSTFATVLSACTMLGALEEGELIHGCIVDNGIELDAVLGTALINIYGKCGAIEKACTVFNHMQHLDVVSWNVMLAAYAQTGDVKKSLQLFQQMRDLGMKPNKATFDTVVSACSKITSIAEGKLIHAVIVEGGFESHAILGTALIDMYKKCGAVEDARFVFDKIPERDVVCWTTIIAAYADHKHGMEALELFKQMQQEGVKPDKVAFISVLSTCANLLAQAEGEAVHACIIDTGLQSDANVGVALVNMYGKCGALEKAQLVFDKLKRHDAISWTAMISAYAQHGKTKEAMKLILQMKQEGIEPEATTFVAVLNACATLRDLREGQMIHACMVDAGLELDVFLAIALVKMYIKCGSLKDASLLLDKMHENDPVLWTEIIDAYTQHGYEEEALQLFWQMQQKGVKPDEITFTSILGACANLTALEEGERIHACIVNNGFDSDIFLCTALVNMYGKCGALENARSVFEKMYEHDAVSWSAIIAAYAHSGDVEEALQLFCRMQQEGVMPDDVTFICLLTACSHAGLVDHGQCLFVSMREDYNITPRLEHYVCMIDVFGRLGQLLEAEEFIYNMPLKADTFFWTSFLGACRAYGDSKRGKDAAKHISFLDPRKSSPYVLLSNIYAADRQ